MRGFGVPWNLRMQSSRTSAFFDAQLPVPARMGEPDLTRAYRTLTNGMQCNMLAKIR